MNAPRLLTPSTHAQTPAPALADAPTERPRAAAAAGGADPHAHTLDLSRRAARPPPFRASLRVRFSLRFAPRPSIRSVAHVSFGRRMLMRTRGSSQGSSPGPAVCRDRQPRPAAGALPARGAGSMRRAQKGRRYRHRRRQWTLRLSPVRLRRSHSHAHTTAHDRPYRRSGPAGPGPHFWAKHRGCGAVIGSQL